MKRFKVAALWTAGKLLAISIFLVTSVGGCSAVFYGVSAVFYPEQTDFPNGVPPASFLVAIENREAKQPDEGYGVVRWEKIAPVIAKTPGAFRVSVKEYSWRHGDPWGFKVIEETPGHQVIELRHSNTQSIKTRYRIEGSRITPISYKTDGGVGLAMLLIPVFLFCLWLGWWAARRATRWVSPAIEALRKDANGQPT